MVHFPSSFDLLVNCKSMDKIPSCTNFSSRLCILRGCGGPGENLEVSNEDDKVLGMHDIRKG